MKNYSKESNEYRGNGHYLIDGEHWFSIWSYKRRNRISGSTSENASEGRSISSMGCGTHSSTPDFGGWSEIVLYPKHALDSFYN